jgi:hypothetical protein
MSWWFNAKHAMIQRSDGANADKVIGSTGGRQVHAETAKHTLFLYDPDNCELTQALRCAEG